MANPARNPSDDDRPFGPRSLAELDLRDYLPHARKWAWKYARGFGGFDEALAVAMEGMVQARNAWHPERGPFHGVVGFYIRTALSLELNRLQAARGVASHERILEKARLRREGRAPMHPGQHYQVISSTQMGANGEEIDLFDNIAGTIPDPEAALIEADEREQARLKIAALMPQLTERERVILQRLYLDDKDPRGRGESDDVVVQRGLAKELGVSPQRVSQLKADLLERLRIALETGEPVMQRAGNAKPKAEAAPRKRPPTTNAERKRIAAAQPKEWIKQNGRWVAVPSP